MVLPQMTSENKLTDEMTIHNLISRQTNKKRKPLIPGQTAIYLHPYGAQRKKTNFFPKDKQ